MKMPQAIDRYRVRERLGQGGMGALFLALDPAIDRLVAIKVLRVDNPDVRERFQREARLAARLQHPNIVTVYDVGEHDGQPFIAMEYIPGETLAELIRRRAPLDTRQRVELVIEICSGLAFAHKHGIVHRDIKPANLILSRDSNILKILDFGIARAGESGLTQVGMVIGTPNYMSPEQVRGDAIDHRSDIFAVGLVLYELLVYRQAFEAETQPAVLMKILSDQPAPLAMLDPLVDAGIAQVVYKALAKNPADRYQDLGAMKADLVRIVQRLETEASDSRTMMVPPPPPRGMQVVPTNPPPSTGGRRLRVRHFAAIDAALAAGDDARARQELQLATQAAPGHPRLGEMGAKISQARTERELARSIGEARARLAAGALTEAGQWLARAQKVSPQAPEVAELRQEIERAADGREQERDCQRRVAAALAHAREAMRSAAASTPPCAPSPRRSASIPTDAEALALRAEIEAARGAGPPGIPRRRHRQPRAVGPPPPASARQLTGAAGRAAQRLAPGRSRAAARRGAAAGAAAAAAGAGRAGRRRRSGRGARRPIGEAAARLPRHRRRRRRSSSASPRSSSGGRCRRASQPPADGAGGPGHAGRRTPPSRRRRRAAGDRPSTPSRSPAPATPTTPSEPPVAPPTTPHSEDAAITARLAHAVTEFQAQRTAPALNTLASLIDEAPQRDDLRQTAEQWARAIQTRVGELRATARKPAQLPPVMRMADGYGCAAKPSSAPAIRLPRPAPSSAAARPGPPIVARQVSRGITEAPSTPASPPRRSRRARPPASRSRRPRAGAAEPERRPGKCRSRR